MQIVDWEEVRFGSILWSWNIMIASLVSQPLWLVSFPKHSRPSMYPFYGATSSAFTWIKTTFLVSLVFSSDLKRRPDWMGKGVAALEWCHWFANQTETCSRCWLSIWSVILLTLDAYTFELNSFLKAGVDSSQVDQYVTTTNPGDPHAATTSSGPMVDLLPAGLISHGLYGGSTFVQNQPTGHLEISENSTIFCETLLWDGPFCWSCVIKLDDVWSQQFERLQWIQWWPSILMHLQSTVHAGASLITHFRLS